MGKSTSCFKLITCSSDTKDDDYIEVSENKGSNDKRGWSFRKRSERHRVLSNTVITETLSSNKESLETADLVYQQPANSTDPEKISVTQCNNEIPQVSTTEDPQKSETVVATENESKVDVRLEVSVVIVIQTAIRGILAQRELLKLKYIVKLQATVRGHLVRRQALVTLRCVQAIIKIQRIVRARRSRVSLEGTYPEKLDGRHEKDYHNSKTWEKENLAKSNMTYTSIERLLRNSFARQLLESKSKIKPINIKCDPSKHDSAWNWLVRWMSVSSVDVLEPNRAELIAEQMGREKEEKFAFQVDSAVPSEVFCESADSRRMPPIIRESDLPSESKENSVAYGADSSELLGCHAIFPEREALERPRTQSVSSSVVKETFIEANTLLDQTAQPEVDSPIEQNSHPGKAETTSENEISMERFPSEQLETGEKRFILGSRKASNPAFIAAQSKFEELTSTANSGRSINSSYEDNEVESHEEAISSRVDTAISREVNAAENTVDHSSRSVPFGVSEGGVELSIFSAPDSPNKSEAGAFENEHEVNITEGCVDGLSSFKNTDFKVKNAPIPLVSNSSHTVLDQSESGVASESINSEVALDCAGIDTKPERTASDLQREWDNENSHLAHRLSPDASPRSHITVPESQGTPSQIPVKGNNRNKTDKSGSNKKRKSLSAGKKSPANQNHDSGSRPSVEHLPKDQKNAKRQNSFGSTRPDHVEQESSESRTNDSLPRFMRATESARAKLQANNSPRSSPDLQDRDVNIKKRHSLPGANGRQVSPRIQRSMSQAEGAKENERKWLR